MKNPEKNAELVVIRRNAVHEGLLAILDDESGNIIGSSSRENGWDEKKNLYVVERPHAGDKQVEFREERRTETLGGFIIGNVFAVKKITFEQYTQLTELISGRSFGKTLELIRQYVYDFERSPEVEQDLILKGYFLATRGAIEHELEGGVKTSQLPLIDKTDPAISLLNECMKMKGRIDGIRFALSKIASLTEREYNFTILDSKKGPDIKKYHKLSEFKSKIKAMVIEYGSDLDKIGLQKFCYGLEE